MKIALLGCKGIPNDHGGYEQFAEYISRRLVKKGHEVFVYNSHTHRYQERKWNGVHILHQYDPENIIGPTGQFIYDINCIMDARKRGFDIILQLGYLSNSVWHRFLPKKKSIIATNMDGLEWKRSKWNKPTQTFLKYAEKLAAKSSHFLIADSVGIQNHLRDTYQKESIYIAYGADVFETPSEKVLESYHLDKYQYDMLVARLEPENNIETILSGFIKTKSTRKILVIGKWQTKYGNYLKEKFHDVRIQFLGGIYNIEMLNNLRYFSNIYFHGHSVGGTNPSLLEAMASNALVCAHDNIFNKSILGDDAYYFNSSANISDIVTKIEKKNEVIKIGKNTKKIREVYNWDLITNQYENSFESMLYERSQPEILTEMSMNV